VTTTTTTPNAQKSGTALLPDIKGTVAAIESGDWMGAAGGIAQTALDVIGISTDPLGAITSAGFGWAVQHVSFLREPFDMLFGDPASIKANAATWTSAGTQLATTAQQYRDTSVSQTTAWTGAAANSYRATSADHANGIEGFAQASQGLSAAITGAGQLVAEIRKVVMDLISQAVNKIIMQIIQALAASWCTFGASIATAVVQIVQTAVSTAQKLLGKLVKLLQSLQKVFQLVVKLVQIFKTVKATIEQIGNQASGTSTPAKA
jgi:DNA anti-recombination protein RmuC